MKPPEIVTNNFLFNDLENRKSKVNLSDKFLNFVRKMKIFFSTLSNNLKDKNLITNRLFQELIDEFQKQDSIFKFRVIVYYPRYCSELISLYEINFSQVSKDKCISQNRNSNHLFLEKKLVLHRSENNKDDLKFFLNRLKSEILEISKIVTTETNCITDYYSSIFHSFKFNHQKYHENTNKIKQSSITIFFIFWFTSEFDIIIINSQIHKFILHCCAFIFILSFIVSKIQQNYPFIDMENDEEYYNNLEFIETITNSNLEEEIEQRFHIAS